MIESNLRDTVQIFIRSNKMSNRKAKRQYTFRERLQIIQLSSRAITT